MSRDPLAVLARLRAMEVEAAKRGLAARRDAQAVAEARAAEARDALPREAAGAAPADYAAWLPGALGERAAAGAAEAGARAMAEAARGDLARARADERAVETLREARAEALERRRARREQAALDEAGERARRIARREG